jgi:hypothetical protein
LLEVKFMHLFQKSSQEMLTLNVVGMSDFYYTNTEQNVRLLATFISSLLAHHGSDSSQKYIK